MTDEQKAEAAAPIRAALRAAADTASHSIAEMLEEVAFYAEADTLLRLRDTILDGANSESGS